MRSLPLVLLLPCLTAAPARADDAADAHAANARGMALYKQKKYDEAAAEFRHACDLSATEVTALYNLACVESLLRDEQKTYNALHDLLERDDPQAAKYVAKAQKDPDLKWFFSTEAGQGIAGLIADKQQPAKGPFAANFLGFVAAAEGKPVAGGMRRLTQAMVDKAAPKHSDDCDLTSDKQGRVFQAVAALDGGGTNVYVTLREGVVAVRGGATVAASEPLGCTGPGESQDFVSAVAVGQVVDDPEPEVVVEFSNGGRRQWTDELIVFKRRGKELVPVLRAIMSSSDDEGAGKLKLEKGKVSYLVPGAKKWSPLKWDAAAFKFK